MVDRVDPRETDLLWPPGASVRPVVVEGPSSAMTLASCVERDDTEDTSSSVLLPNQLELVEVLFLRGRGGRCFPGNSVRSLR